MEYIYTTLLLHETKQPINEDNIKKVLTAANVAADHGKIKALVAALEGVNIEEAIKELPIAAAHKTETKKEEHKEEVKVDEDKAAAGLGSLFG
jgi:large subunit ribosomal protein L12